jgi:hypothetical protein
MRHRIHIPLADQPEVLRSAEAKAVGYGKFTVLGPVAPGERWQFMPGEIVECESRTLADGSKGLVAVSSSLRDPEERSRRIVYGWTGAVVGGILGLWIETWMGGSFVSLLAAGAFCSVTFAICSMHWGDAAWDMLSRLLRR